MKFSDIKNDVIVPKSQHIIDKKVIVDDKEFHILSAYEDDNCVKIIILNVEDEILDDNENFNVICNRTHREELVSKVKYQRSSNLEIKDLYFDDKKVSMSGSSTGGGLPNHYDYFMISYIANLGIDLEYLDDILFSNIIVATYRLSEKSLESLNLDKVKILKITRRPSFETKLVNFDYRLSLNKNEYSFIDENKEKQTFKARLIEYDIWAEVPMLEEMHKELYEKLDDKEKELYKKPDYENLYNDICPKGMNLLCVVYESDVQLNFHTKQYLNTKVDMSSSSSSSRVFFKRDEETGERICILEPTYKNKVDCLEVELFSMVKITENDDVIVGL